MTDDHQHTDDHADCERALAELYEFLDGELTDERRSMLAEHLDACNPCLEVFDFEAELRQVIAQRCRDEVPQLLWERIAECLRTASDAPGAAEMG